MRLYAVETTDKMKLCGINARNIQLCTSLEDAKVRADILAVHNPAGGMHLQSNIIGDSFLDHTMKIYDESNGDAESAPALAWITKIDI